MTIDAFRPLGAGRPSGSRGPHAFTAKSTRSRRTLVKQAALASAVAPLAGTWLPSLGADSVVAASQDAAPDAGTDRQVRGKGDPLQILLSRAPSGAAAHSARSSVDWLASAPVLEPLMQMLPDGTLVPTLIDEVPTVANGLLSKDFGSARFTFPRDLTWSDGEPVTSADLVFTWQWVTEPGNQSSNSATWGAISAVKAVDDQTADVTFAQPSADWYAPFTGSDIGCLYPAHCFDNDPTNRNDAFITAPVGTGPFVITAFSPDTITYAVNDAYRDSTKP